MKAAAALSEETWAQSPPMWPRMQRRCAMSNMLTEQPILRAASPNSTQATWLTPLF